MCKFASFIFKPDTMEIRVADLNHHAQTYERLGLKDGPEPDGWREGHYLPSGEIECRVVDGDSVTAVQAVEIVRAKWSTFPEFFEWAVVELGGVVGGLDLRSYAHPLPAGLTTTGYLDLGSYAHPLPAGLTTTGYLYLDSYAHPLPAAIRHKDTRRKSEVRK